MPTVSSTSKSPLFLRITNPANTDMNRASVDADELGVRVHQRAARAARVQCGIGLARIQRGVVIAVDRNRHGTVERADGTGGLGVPPPRSKRWASTDRDILGRRGSSRFRLPGHGRALVRLCWTPIGSTANPALSTVFGCGGSRYEYCCRGLSCRRA